MKKNIIKKVIKWVIGLCLIIYITGYLISTAPVFYDYFKYNKQRIESGKTAQNLHINKYTLEITGIEKHLVLVGEQHDYNKKEHEIAETLIKQYRYIASEPRFSREGLTLKNKLFLTKLRVPLKIVNFYQHLGNGRWYTGISMTATKQGRKVYELEPVNEPTDLLEKDFKKFFIRWYFREAFSFKGPYNEYDFAKGEDIIEYADSAKQNRDDSFERQGKDVYGMATRDKVMAENIIALLEKNGVDSLLATAGNAHIPGILKHLSEKATLTKIE
ncbi:MAG: hypothetical protein PHE49_07350 [bacterium]|nr:hypothetical protein [bacterium]